MIPFFKLTNRNRRKLLTRTSVLLLALATAALVLQAQESDHINGPHKTNDPTGAWLIGSSLTGPDGKPLFFLTVFHHQLRHTRRQ